MRTNVIGNVALGMAALMLGACAHGRAQRGGETITLSTERCFGTCPVYQVTLGPDGQGIFSGQQFTAVTGERRFQASPEQVRAFTRALAGIRPARDRALAPGLPGCGLAPTDMPSTAVRWQGIDGAVTLQFYHGCARDNRKVADALRTAPTLLPIADFIGRR